MHIKKKNKPNQLIQEQWTKQLAVMQIFVAVIICVVSCCVQAKQCDGTKETHLNGFSISLFIHSVQITEVCMFFLFGFNKAT